MRSAIPSRCPPEASEVLTAAGDVGSAVGRARVLPTDVADATAVEAVAARVEA